MDFDDHDDDDIEMDNLNNIPPPPGYENINNNNNNLGSKTDTRTWPVVRYRECLKNHAVGMGGHAVDGCGEFLPSGEDGTLDALRCAACACHRNFHRKDTGGGGGNFPPQPFYRPPAGYLHLTAGAAGGRRPLALPASGQQEEEELVSNPSSSGGGGGASGGNNGGSKKRFRTKFTAEQKEKMAVFAERLGWRMQRHDDEAVERFCGETGVKRQVLKVWMHNNKHTLGKKHHHQQPQQQQP